MRTRLLLLALVLCMGRKALAGEETAPVVPKGPTGRAEDVMVLTQMNFDMHIKAEANDQWLLEFYAPWCGHCKALVPIYEQVATVFKDSNTKVAKIDCTSSKDLCARFGVSGFPTIKFIHGAVGSRRVSDYNSERSLGGFASYVFGGQLPTPIAAAVKETGAVQLPEDSQPMFITAYSDPFPKPGEYIEAAGIMRTFREHPYLSWGFVAFLVALVGFFIYIIMWDSSMASDEDEAIARVRANAELATDQQAKDRLAAFTAAREKELGTYEEPQVDSPSAKKRKPRKD
jgi:protein disulfide-isomerase-like protein